MTLTKREVLKVVNTLPQPIDIDELICRLYLKKKLAAAEEDIRKGRTIPHAQVMREVSTWFVSGGRMKRRKI